MDNVVSKAQNRPHRQRSIVLVVDDNAAIRDMVSWALELDGYEAAEAAEGREALAWMDNAAREGRYPAVILLDLYMPGMDGDAFLQQLQAQWEKANPMPAIVLITASQNAPGLSHIHANQVIIKPFHVRDLLDTVRDLIM
jgi:two-component system, chemotaxis family, chemotaxis protein CheY